ncbi:MAG: hypothetical protein PHT12_06360 [Patescibacteria group bacterium]|nr:hypothetical protein [Patescibacteria group bacterium]
MTQSKYKKGRLLVGLFCVLLGLSAPAANRVEADVMQSTNFKIQTDTISIGGGRSTSAGFVVEDTLGDLATGEDMASASFKGCSGFQCFQQSEYISFSVAAGTSAPGTVGQNVALGTISTSAVSTSNHSSINSIFITAGSNGSSSVITVRSTNAGLKSASINQTIASASTTLVAGTAGYGVCILSASQMTAQAPYDGTCNTTTGHQVGVVDNTSRAILSAASSFSSGSAEILVKAARSSTTPGAIDYADDLRFIMTATY